MEIAKVLDQSFFSQDLASTEVEQTQHSFAEMLSALVSQTEEHQQQADMAIQGLHSGEEKNLHEAMIAIEKADISLRYMVQVRNKAVEAYQEVMRMTL